MATSYTSTQILSSNIKIYSQFWTITLSFKKQVCVGFYGLPGREEDI